MTNGSSIECISLPKIRSSLVPQASSCAFTSDCGWIHPASGNHKPAASTGTPACALASSRVTYCAYSAGKASAAIEARCEASSFASRASWRTPQRSQRTLSSFLQRDNPYRKPHLVRRAKTLSSGVTSGWKLPAWLPEASCAGIAWRSMSRTCQPRAQPHVGIPGRREAVQVDRIGREAQLAQQLDVREEQRQHDPAGVELEAMRARHQHRPAGVKLLCLVPEFGITRM